jgi:hypothetical protein
MCGLVDGETVVAAVMVVTTETNDVVVDADVVERLDTVVWADVAEQTDVFFLAFSDYIKRHISALDLGVNKASACRYNSRQSPDQVQFRNPGSHQRSGRRLNPHEDQRNGSPL